jgi:hypothetical protein
LATLLYYNSGTLEHVRCYHYLSVTTSTLRHALTIPPSNGSFSWSLIDKPRSLILPRCGRFEIQIGSSILMNALYLPSAYHICTSGSAIVRPFPNIRSIAPLCSSILIDLSYQFQHVTPYKKPQDAVEREVTKPIIKAGIREGDADKDAFLLSPCPIPLSSIIDNALIDELIIATTPSTTSPTASSMSDGKRNNQSFDQILIRMGNGYMTLSQVRRLVDAVTQSISWKHSTSVRGFSLRSIQPLIFDHLNGSNATTISLTGPSSHLKVNNDYMINSIFELVVKMARWVLPRSSSSVVMLPPIILAPDQWEIFQKRCIDSFGSHLQSRLWISVGQTQ